MAIQIASSEGSLSVVRILGNLAMIFDDDQVDKVGGYRHYVTQHWREIMLLFVNHPSMECRALGYKVLRQSGFWQDTRATTDTWKTAKILIDGWFQHMKNRYTWQDEKNEALVLDELEALSKLFAGYLEHRLFITVACKKKSLDVARISNSAKLFLA